MTKDEVAKLMQELFNECQFTREAGQKEYAHDTSNAFANFERISRDLGVDRKQVLWIYAYKHIDGIVAAIKGHVSQREPVRGRIKDLIVYLCLLEGMFQEEGSNPNVQTNTPFTVTPNKIPQYPPNTRAYNDWAGETVIGDKSQLPKEDITYGDI